MRELKIKGIYRHFKGELCIVEDIAFNSAVAEKIDVNDAKQLKLLDLFLINLEQYI